MSYKTFTLLEHMRYSSYTPEYSAPIKGAGYNLHNSLHTYTYELEEFLGLLTLQGTLEIDPVETDWIDINGAEFIADGSTDYVSNNFEGNFTWIRAKYQLDNGIIHAVRCNI